MDVNGFMASYEPIRVDGVFVQRMLAGRKIHRADAAAAVAFVDDWIRIIGRRDDFQLVRGDAAALTILIAITGIVKLAEDSANASCTAVADIHGLGLLPQGGKDQAAEEDGTPPHEVLGVHAASLRQLRGARPSFSSPATSFAISFDQSRS